MGKHVSFPSNGHTCQGYLARPESGGGPGVVVIQEWWGLVPHIEDLCVRFAKEGFLAIAPDLYHGEKATSPDDAAKLLMELNVEKAYQEISGSANYVLGLDECTSAKFGVVGFCMGGALAQFTAAKNSKTGAAVSFYGGFKAIDPPWKDLGAPLLLVYGEDDQGVPVAGGRLLEATLNGLGKNVELVVYEGAGHAFFNDSRPAVYNEEAARDSWQKTLELFRASL